MTVHSTPEPDLGLIIAILRTRRRWSQRRLAEAAHVRRSAISDYEKGKVIPEFPTVERLVTGMGYSLAAIDRTREFIRFLDEDGGIECLRPQPPGAQPSGLPDEFAVLAAEGGRLFAGFFRKAFLKIHAYHEAVSSPGGREASVPADALLERLLAIPPAKRVSAIVAQREFRDWRLAIFLSDRSLEAASRSPKRANELADLAVAIADRLEEADPACATKVQGYARWHLGNALRAQGRLADADRVFDMAEKLVAAGRDFRSDLLEEARLPALKAALRLAQGRLDDCLYSLDQALAMRPSPRLHTSILITKAGALEERWDLPGTVAVLQEADALIDRGQAPRLYLCVRQNLLDALSKSGRFQEAEALLPEVQRLARRHASPLDRTRLQWIEGRIAAGSGDVPRGIELLTAVRGALASDEISFDTALVSLELAGLYAQEGNTAAVKALAGHMAPIFKANVLHREALAALAYFRQAAEREEVTTELASRLATYLTRSRHNPGLRFTEGGADT